MARVEITTDSARYVLSDFFNTQFETYDVEKMTDGSTARSHYCNSDHRLVNKMFADTLYGCLKSYDDPDKVVENPPVVAVSLKDNSQFDYTIRLQVLSEEGAEKENLAGNYEVSVADSHSRVVHRNYNEFENVAEGFAQALYSCLEHHAHYQPTRWVKAA